MLNNLSIPIEVILCIGIIVFLTHLLYKMLSDKYGFDELEESSSVSTLKFHKSDGN
jgi:hypothetical protein